MSSTDYKNKWAETRKAALVRDQHRCQNCRKSREDASVLQVHHIVPQGEGGSNRLSNLKTLCRECHRAVHGDTIAPTVEIASSREMNEEEFEWFKHFIKEILPAIASEYKVRIEPIFIEKTGTWNVPVADMKLLDEQINNRDDVNRYKSPTLDTF
jgi:hypothetical protein